jgi:hypothetical protein
VTTAAVLTSWLSRRHAIGLLVVALVAALVASRLVSRQRPWSAIIATSLARRGIAWTSTPGRPAVATLAGALLAIVVIVSHGTKARATAGAIHGEALFGRAAAVLDREPPGTRVAVFGDQWIYPAFGDRSHLRPVRLDADGRLARAPIGGAMTPGPLAVDPVTFGANLRAAGVGAVVIVHMPHPGRDPAWPSQHAGLHGVAGASRVYEDRGVSVWRLDSAPR